MSDLSSTRGEPTHNFHRLHRYSKWDISLSKWDMPIIACNATMAALLRCVTLPWRLWHMPYSQIFSSRPKNRPKAAVASQRARDRRSYVRRHQNSSVWESQEPSSVCQCHDRRSALFSVQKFRQQNFLTGWNLLWQLGLPFYLTTAVTTRFYHTNMPYTLTWYCCWWPVSG